MRQVLPLLAAPLCLVLCGFTPFTPVQDVCPSCARPPADQVKLTSGQTFTCKVLAQNDDYYVVSRFGEFRAVMKSEIASIRWAAKNGGAALASGDQVLLRNGVVLHGAVVEQQPRLLVIQVGGLRHVVWLSQIHSLHRGGHQQDLTTPAAPAP